MNVIQQRLPLLAVYVMFIAILIAVAACSALGITPVERKPATVEESLYMAAATGKGFTLTMNDLRAAQTISHDQHQMALNQLQHAKDITTAGLAAFALGHFSEAKTKLDQADAVLRIVAGVIAQIETHRGENP
jgi:hypothetical protein